MTRLILWIISLLVVSGCLFLSRGKDSSEVTEESWGSFKGKEVKLFTLMNDKGITI